MLGALSWILIGYPRQRGPSTGTRAELTIEEGAQIESVARQLGELGVLRHPRLFTIYMRWLGGDEHLRVGTFSLTDEMTPAHIARRIALGFGRAPVRVTIPEGFNRFDLAERLEHHGVCKADEFLAASVDPAVLANEELDAESFEGYLFPDTYELATDMRPAIVIKRLIRTFRRRVIPLMDEDAAGLAKLRDELGYGIDDVLILASVVEKEAAVPEERSTIAGVFLNRLRSETFRPRHRLQADPTVSYGCLADPDGAPSCAGFEGRITRAMLNDSANRYNSYRHAGLPPTPICNPGLATIRSVLRAEEHEFLFFVARGGRRHAFSRELDRHNKNVDRFIRDE